MDGLFSSSEKSILAQLGTQVMEVASTQAQSAKMELWRAHNDGEHVKSPIFCDPENGWNEIILPSDLLCQTPLAREWEFRLRRELFWGLHMGDDRPVLPYFDVGVVVEDDGWGEGLAFTPIGGDQNGAYTWEGALSDYGMLDKLHFPRLTPLAEKSAERLALAHEIFDGSLLVRQRTSFFWSMGMTQEYIKLRGLENFLMDFYDYPEEMHRTMRILCDGYLARLADLEAKGLLCPNTDGAYLGSGSFGYTSKLTPSSVVHPMQMWGFCESQETSSVSPAQFEEFILPYQLEILSRFGLNYYGCCEALDMRWEAIAKIPRLRKISVSAWADVEKLSEVCGKDIILGRKPLPTELAFPKMDHERVREGLRKDMASARRHGASIEFVMKDNHTIGKNPQNVIDWCAIAQEVANG